MFDSEIVLDLLSRIVEATRRIERRMEGIESPEDFMRNDDSLTRLDAIGMMLIAIGESLKMIDKHVPADFFADYPEVNWRAAKGMRDFLSHAYWDLEIETVFNACKESLPKLKDACERLAAEVGGIGA
jgi:uncharacterized protein with HEPN domain